MQAHHVNEYLNLIQQLLNCSEGEEWILLKQHASLIDSQLIILMEQIASELETKGNTEQAQYLRHWIGQLGSLLKQPKEANPQESRSQAYLDLIEALLSCPKGSELEVLESHQELIDPGLVQMMMQVATQLATQGNEETALFLNQLALQINHIVQQTTEQQTPMQQTPAATHPMPSAEQVDFMPEEVLQDRHPEASFRSPFSQQSPTAESLSQPRKVSSPMRSQFVSNPSREMPSSANSANVAANLEMNRRIDQHLAVIAESLAQLSELVAARLHTPDPLWYMSALEQAQDAHWVLTSEEVEKLIGIQPACADGKNSFQHGCWIFIKVEKDGNFLGWRVIKEKTKVHA